MCPKTIRPWDNVPRRQYAPGQSAPETICPKDIMPRRQSAPETTCPGDNLPLETTCPGDNPPRRQHAPRQYAPETSCPRRQYAPGDNLLQETMCPIRQCSPRDNVPRETIVELEWGLLGAISSYTVSRINLLMLQFSDNFITKIKSTLCIIYFLSIENIIDNFVDTIRNSLS